MNSVNNNKSVDVVKVGASDSSGQIKCEKPRTWGKDCKVWGQKTSGDGGIVTTGGERDSTKY